MTDNVGVNRQQNRQQERIGVKRGFLSARSILSRSEKVLDRDALLARVVVGSVLPVMDTRTCILPPQVSLHQSADCVAIVRP
jgi:hypothetical protein